MTKSTREWSQEARNRWNKECDLKEAARTKRTKGSKKVGKPKRSLYTKWRKVAR